jgi:predicted NBD/HSP70 family sugar kinase
LVTERRTVRSDGPGRPSPIVAAAPEGAVVLAIDLAVDSIAVATVGLGGHVFNRLRIDRPRDRFSPDETVDDAVKLAEPLLGALPEGHHFAGVGVAVVGVTRRADGYVHLAPNLGWRDVPLGHMLTERLGWFDADVAVANEADLGALSEHRRGVKPGVSNLLFVSGEVGIGVGIIIGGEPGLGAAGYAGEAGHTLINPAGSRCRCGSIGCWETEAGEGALLRRAGAPVAGGRAAVDRVIALAEAGDAKVLAALDSVGGWLGLGIADLVNLFNPELVVLGGLFSRIEPLIRQATADSMGSRVLAAPGSMVEVVPTALGIDAQLIGAAELALSGIIANPAQVAERPLRSL